MRELALFAGAGGGILEGHLLGWSTVCAVEIDAFCRSVLLSRQQDGMLSRFPIWDDVRTFNGRPWRDKVDVISGGFPCQDISSARSTSMRAGLVGPKSGLWKEFRRIIEEVEAPFVFIENSPNLRTNGLVTVLQDLARLGYNAEWCVLGAKDVGAPHIRKRMWILAYANNNRERDEPKYAQMACTPKTSGTHLRNSDSLQRRHDWWPMDLIQGVDDGVANRMDRIKATGNGQVPAVARLAWRTLISRIGTRPA